MTTPQNISKQQFVDLLLNIRGATFITITTKTDTKAKKTGNPYGTILKTNTINGQVNFHYDKAVLTKLAKEGKNPDVFEQGNSWHQPYMPNGLLTPLATKKGETIPNYLRIRHLNTIGNTIYTTETGTQLTEEQVTPFLKTPSRYSNQGTDEPVRFLTYSLDSIITATINGQTYLIA